jgi:ADP-ribosyl-[dinitrogen reductase] hydrolase
VRGDVADRATGALLGLACGDAVGTTLEFEPPGSFRPIDDMVGGGPFHLKAGEWTDDTSMALCLAESILDTNGMDLADQLRRYLLWRENAYLSSNGKLFDIGSTTTSQLSRFARTGEPVDPHPNEEAAANGSLMRLAAVPIRWHGDVAETAERAAESSRTTHPATRPVDACRVLGAMTAAMIAGASAEDVLSPGFWGLGELHPAIEAVARGSWQGKEPPDIRGTGYCVGALEAAIWAVAGADNFRTAVLRAANLGDDADTTAAIAGQLAGARWGASGIPGEWRARVVAAERITALALGLVRMSDDSVPAAQWPHDQFLHAWWVEPGKVLAGEYPGDPHPSRAAMKVNLLLDWGIRTFVDLTTDGELLPYEPLLEEACTHRQLDVEYLRFPIPDFNVIPDEGYRMIVDAILEGRRRGGVYVHCWGGVGRTCTVVGCLMAEGDVADEDIDARLRELRSGTDKADRPCPETPAQREVIRRWRRSPA